jgi:hypothetical protein
MLDNAVIFEKAFARLNKENRQRVMFLHLNLIGAMLGVLFIFSRFSTELQCVCLVLFM